MFDLKPILFVIGILLSILALSMLVPAILDAAAGNPDWVVFVASSLVTLFAGVSLVLTTRTAGPRAISVRQAFLLTSLSWLAVASFAALPFAFASRDIGYAGAFFEAMSGLTTTGATVLTGLDGLPPGILFWRALLQWMGGIGIIVTSVAVLPMLRIGGMQLFRTESSDTSEKILPRATQLAGAIGRVYVVLTVGCALALWAAGMNGFDAITHAMTTLSTGGFSTHDASVRAFDSPMIEAILILFMILGSLPFVLYIRWMQRERMALWRDSQVRAFLALVAVVWVVLTAWLTLYDGMPVLTALRLAAFNSTSVITTTGFATGDYSAWGPLPGHAVLLDAVCRRLYRIDHWRLQGLPPADPSRRCAQAYQPACPPQRRRRADLQSPPGAGRHPDVGDELLFPVRGDVPGAHRHSGRAGAGLHHRDQWRGDCGRQCRPRPGPDHRARQEPSSRYPMRPSWCWRRACCWAGWSCSPSSCCLPAPIGAVEVAPPFRSSFMRCGDRPCVRAGVS